MKYKLFIICGKLMLAFSVGLTIGQLINRGHTLAAMAAGIYGVLFVKAEIDGSKEKSGND